MRIIAGMARGRRLVAPDTAGTRPATDRVREAVFSSLGASVEGASVLDLYAGSGSFGLEALSRGASDALFVESGRKAVDALTRNVQAVGLGGTIVTARVKDFLLSSGGQYDLVFSDPPWLLPASEMASDLAMIDRVVTDGGEIVVSRRSGDELPEVPENWRVAADRRYGDTRILRYEKKVL